MKMFKKSVVTPSMMIDNAVGIVDSAVTAFQNCSC